MRHDIPQDMRILDLSFSDFRNYEYYSLESIGDLTIFVGKNGVGKTNVLEAIQLMTSASSFRHPQVAQLVRQGCEHGRIQTRMSDGNRSLSVELLLEPGKKKYLVNGKAKGIADVRGTLPAVVFTPDDLQLAKKSSSVKRDALDDLGVQLTRNYYIVRRDYEKTVRYKNRLLKEEASRALVESINETLITCGSQLFCYRTVLFDRLVPLVEKNYAALIGDETLERPEEGFTAVYHPSWRKEGDCSVSQRTYERGEVKELLAQHLQAAYDDERLRKRSIIGPHADKIEFMLSGRDASSFASQGQQRSIVLAWKLAEVELTRQSLGTSPVLLLDDVMSELDATRRDMLVRFVTGDIQTFITATDLSNINNSLIERARVVELR